MVRYGRGYPVIVFEEGATLCGERPLGRMRAKLFKDINVKGREGMPPLRINRIALYVMTRAAAAILILTSGAIAANARDKQASIVIDGNTGRVLHAEKADELRYPASLTKMMTLYMAFDQIESGRMSKSTKLTVSKRCSGKPPSKIGLKPGSKIALDDAMKALVTKSANDIACVVAEAISGSEWKFASDMTRRARQIGMSSTTFRNASGLPHKKQLTTARDMALLGLRLRDEFPTHYSLFKLRSFRYAGKTYKSHNSLLKNFTGMDGIKTGYTRASGFNLVSSVKRDGKYVVGAVFGGVSSSVRNAHMRVILFHALGKASTEKTRKVPQMIARRSSNVKSTAAAVYPKPVRKPVAHAAVRPAPSAVEPPPAQQPPAIQIAKVRAVKITGDNAAESNKPAPAPVQVAPRRQPQFATAAVTGAPAREPRAQTGTRQPGTFEDQIAALTARSTNTAPSSLGMRPAQQDSGADRGGLERARSIMGYVPARPTPPAVQQPTPQYGGGSYQVAAAKAAARAAPSPRRAAPPPAAQPVAGPPPVAGTHLIQVGAFASMDDCKRHLNMVQDRAGELLRDRHPRAEHAQVGSREVYRARFAGFDNAAAKEACSSLRQKKVDCMVLRQR